MKIVNYSAEYKKQIYDLQSEQWGEGSDTDEIMNNLDQYKIKIVAEGKGLFGAAMWHFVDKDVCYIDFIVLKKQIQHCGWGRKLMNEILKSANENKCKFIECEAIDVFGKINSKNLLESTGFVEQFEIKNYWGDKYPDFDCKECGRKPCVCSMHKYRKELNF